MHTLIRRGGVAPFATRELPALLVALVLAELFYKLHSFTLEALAFLATWYGSSFLTSLVRSAFTSPRREASTFALRRSQRRP